MTGSSAADHGQEVSMRLVAGFALSSVTLLAAPAAHADPVIGTEMNRPDPYSYAWVEPRLITGIGVDVTLGGGVMGFTDSLMRDALSSSVGGLWAVRATIGSHVPIALDLSYLGEAANVQSLASGASNGTLIGSTVEGALRWNILPHAPWNPYVFAGVGWQSFQVSGASFAAADSGMKTSDNNIEFPVGVGLSLRDYSGWMVDVRGTFRDVVNSTLVFDPRTGGAANGHWWEASAAIGYEF
jgi:hypothetical protein